MIITSLIVLLVTSGGASIASFATLIGIPVGITSASLSLVFSLCTGLVKKLLKVTRNKKKTYNKVVWLARSKLSSIESKISGALINNQISHEEFITIINEERSYRELRESIRMMNIQEYKKIDIDFDKYKYIDTDKYKTMLSYCLKCKKNTESIDPKFLLQLVMVEQ